MTRPLAVLRPVPGNAATAARIEAIGLTALRLPLFEVRPIAWRLPDPSEHDAILFTSANAPRHGGADLGPLVDLPAYAIGTMTAAAARDAGFTVAMTGDGDWQALYALATTQGVRRGLLLTGKDHLARAEPPVARVVPVYTSDFAEVSAQQLGRLAGSVALLHSARAAARLADLVRVRRDLRIVALSAAVLAAAGDGWAESAIAERPDDRSLIAAARRLAD